MLRTSQMDPKLEALKGLKEPDESSAGPILDAHAHLVELFRRLTSKNKRWLASRYLHFHRPDLFFIYDSRAVAGIRALAELPDATLEVSSGDRQYARFVGAAIGLHESVRSHLGRRINPRN